MCHPFTLTFWIFSCTTLRIFTVCCYVTQVYVCNSSEGQSAAIPVASMEFAAICLRNALLLLPEHQQNDSKSDNGSKSCSQSGSTESCGETGDSCRYPTSTRCRFLHVLNRININNCINKHSFKFSYWDALCLILDAVLSRPADLLLWQRKNPGGRQVYSCRPFVPLEEAGGGEPQVRLQWTVLEWMCLTS